MAGITLERAQAKLEIWLNAEDKVAGGQEYSINNRALKRADLPEIRKTIDYWEGRVNRLSGSARRGISYAKFS